MNRKLLLLFALLALATGSAIGQGYTPPRGKGKAKTGVKPAGARKAAGGVPAPRRFLRQLKIANPVLVLYRQAPPGRAAQQLIMDEEDLPLLRYLTPEQLVGRREVVVDGLGNLPLPGTDNKKYRLVGTHHLATGERQPAGDGQSSYVRLKIPGPGVLYVVQESADEYRHFVRGPQSEGLLLDFQANELPGVDSVRAAYVLRRIDAAERGAGTGAGATVR